MFEAILPPARRKCSAVRTVPTPSTWTSYQRCLVVAVQLADEVHPGHALPEVSQRVGKRGTTRRVHVAGPPRREALRQMGGRRIDVSGRPGVVVGADDLPGLDAARHGRSA